MVAPSMHKFVSTRPEDWETDDLHIEELHPLAVAIDRDMPDERMDARAIARFQTGLISFMENALGPNSMPPRPFPKLPFTWIDDSKTNGTLRDVIMKCYQLKEGKGLKSLEWRDLQQRMALLDILSYVRSSMEKNGFPVTPTVYFDKSVPEADLAELTGFVWKMKGKVVTDRNAVGLTHIIFPFGPHGDPDDGEEEYMRTQRKRGTKALVHRWYTPDSHNEWVDMSVAPEQIENDAEHLLSGPAKVYVRWVKDSRRYNEWMNMVDYETDEGNEDHERYKKELEQRGFTPAQFLERKRKARQAGGANKTQMFEAEQEVDPNFREEITEGVVRRHVRFTNKRIKEGLAQSENISWGQMAKVYDGADASAAMAHVQLPREMTSLPAPAADAHVRMPVYAHWFRMATINEIERNANVEFFNGRSSIKTPEQYVEYRNFMVQRYRKCPQARLTFLDCRQHLVGDVNAIRRVWTFLDSWGLINFEADPVPVLDEPMEVLTVDESGDNPQQVKTIRPGRSAMRTPTPQTVLSLPIVTPEKAVLLATTTNDGENQLSRIGADTSLLNKKDPSSKAAGKEEQTGGKLQFFCNAMPWVDCTACRFHCTRVPDIDLCPQAFAEGRFPPGTCSKDFIKIDVKSSKGRNPSWSDQEHLLLLEAIELFGENFDKVAEYVGTKNQLDCVMQFLQMPIDEECVSNLRHSTVSRGAMCINPSAAVSKRDFPFSREENPVASQLIFLAEVVGAKIAAAAASAAMQELFEKNSILHEELLYSAAMSAGIEVPAPQLAGPRMPAPGTTAAGAAASSVDPNGAAPMDVDAPGTSGGAPAAPAANGSANGVNGHVNENVVQDVAAAIPLERLHAASAAAFLGAGTKAKLLAEAEGVLLSGHAMTVLECMTQKMVVKNKYLNDVENEISSVHSKLVDTRAAALKQRDSIATKKALLKKEKDLLAAAEKKQRAELASDGMLPKGSGSGATKKPADGEIPEGAAKKVAKPAENPAAAGTSAAAAAAPAAAPASPATAAAPAAAPAPAAAAPPDAKIEGTPSQTKKVTAPVQDAAAKKTSSKEASTPEQAQPPADDGPQPMDTDSPAEQPQSTAGTESQQAAAVAAPAEQNPATVSAPTATAAAQGTGSAPASAAPTATASEELELEQAACEQQSVATSLQSVNPLKPSPPPTEGPS